MGFGTLDNFFSPVEHANQEFSYLNQAKFQMASAIWRQIILSWDTPLLILSVKITQKLLKTASDIIYLDFLMSEKTDPCASPRTSYALPVSGQITIRQLFTTRHFASNASRFEWLQVLPAMTSPSSCCRSAETVFKRAWTSDLGLLMNPPPPPPMSGHGGSQILRNVWKWSQMIPRWIPDRPTKC